MQTRGRCGTWIALLCALGAGCNDSGSGVDLGGRDGPKADTRRIDGRRVDGSGKHEAGWPPREAGWLDGGAGECEGVGNRLRLTFVLKSLELTSSDVKLASGAKGVVGFTGTTSDGQSYWIGRQGATDDGAFSESKSYDASRAPYHMQLQLWPSSSGSTCNGNAKCETYYGLNGNWKIITSTAPTAGIYIIGAITDQLGCWVEKPSGPPDLSKCLIVGGTIYGCFKVN
jgi:hypothetical protein